MQKIGRGRFYDLNKRSRKKHVESMFLTNKNKKYPNYHKPPNVSAQRERKKNLVQPVRRAYSIKVLQGGYVTLRPLKAVVRIFKWFVKTQGVETSLKLKLNLFPDFVLTSKPKEMRMGKGKGTPDKKVAIIKGGGILLTIACEDDLYYLGLQLIKRISQKVPFKHKIIFSEW